MKAIAAAEVSFSLKEAAVLSGLPEDKLRREIEHKVIAPRTLPTGSAHRLLFGAAEILYFGLLSSFSGTVELTPPTRAKVCRLLVDAFRGPARWTRQGRDARVARLNRDWASSINAVITVDWNALIEELGPRIDLYRAGLKQLREDDEILGGEPVFAGTRIAVRHIGTMRAKGEPAEAILVDYPELAANDIEFALLYTQAHPMVGRPKSGVATG